MDISMKMAIYVIATALHLLKNIHILTAFEYPIPGIPGLDYPIYNEIPDTSFSCSDKIEAGYYADPETNCQVFHVCISNGNGGLMKASMLCINGTIFNQELFTCDYWFNFNCRDAIGFYYKNEELEAEREAASNFLHNSTQMPNKKPSGNFTIGFTAIGRGADPKKLSNFR